MIERYHIQVRDGPEKKKQKMVKVFAILRPVIRLLMKFYGLSPQIIETEPGTQIKIWAPSKSKSESKPNIVFLHGFGADGILNWLSQVMAISSNYAVYVPDLLFFGESITDKPGRSTAFQAEVIAAALKKIGVKKCTVVGLSYGASIGFKMAELCPELVEFVVASDTIIEFNESLSRAVVEKYGFPSLPEFLLPTTVVLGLQPKKAKPTKKEGSRTNRILYIGVLDLIRRGWKLREKSLHCNISTG